jgi:hypothetical protein
MRVLVRANCSAQALVTGTTVEACPLRAFVRNGRWLAEVPPGGACSSFLDRAKSLPTETRKNLGRHLVGLDSETLAKIDALLH